MFARHITPVFGAARTIRTMATTTASANKPKLEWLIIVPDRTEPGTLQKRIDIRPKHLNNIASDHAAGIVPMGGAYLKEHPKDANETPQMLGSALVLVADSEAAAREKLRDDIYAKEGVWDVDNAQIWPFRTALRSAKE